MPRETFFNLPEAKRKRILDLALDEFAGGSYREASLTRIVKRAGIAKGSLYQYFEDKFDLYFYLLGLAGERKLLYIQEAMAALGPEPDFFAMMKAAMAGGFRLVREDPRLLALGNRMLQEPDLAVRQRVMAHFGSMGEEMLAAWIRQGMERGQLDPGLNPGTAAHVVLAVSQVVSQVLASGKLSVDQAEEMAAEVMAILEHGLRPRGARRGENRRDRG
ncbi:MAG: TetR/AcrR family transcriptional regulator [bacterium]|nr:TetR/AcrR family transcriptional regulator [bacterium]